MKDQAYNNIAVIILSVVMMVLGTLTLTGTVEPGMDIDPQFLTFLGWFMVVAGAFSTLYGASYFWDAPVKDAPVKDVQFLDVDPDGNERWDGPEHPLWDMGIDFDDAEIFEEAFRDMELYHILAPYAGIYGMKYKEGVFTRKDGATFTVAGGYVSFREKGVRTWVPYDEALASFLSFARA